MDADSLYFENLYTNVKTNIMPILSRFESMRELIMSEDMADDEEFLHIAD